MVACTASPGRLFAAPFAVVGSIGVIGQSVNIHKALKGWGVEPLVFRGGRDKSPVGLIGEVTKEGVAKVQDVVDKTHAAFKKHVVNARPALEPCIDELATGDIWLGYNALEAGLVDRLISSDEYVGERLADGARVLKLVQLKKPKYPFSRPTIGVSRAEKPQDLFSRSDVISDLPNFLQNLADTVRNWAFDGNRILPTFPKATGVKVAGLSSKHA